MNMNEKMNEIKSNKSLLWGILVVIIILVLVFAVKGDKNKTGELEENTLGEENTALSAEPVVSGDYEYAFSGVEWVFDTEDPQVVGTNQTYLKMIFADFTRNGSAISFGRPYKLGFHPGTCKDVDFIDTTSEKGTPLAYAECSDGKTTREFVVLQEMENIIVKMNETIGEESTGFKDWYKINITEIVK